MSEDYNPFTKVTPGRGTKTNIVTPNPQHPTRIPRFQSEVTARTTLFPTVQDPVEEDWTDIDMGITNLIKLETLLPEVKQCKNPTTKDVISLVGVWVWALGQCCDQLPLEGDDVLGCWVLALFHLR